MTQYDMTINIPDHCHVSMQTQSRSQKYQVNNKEPGCISKDDCRDNVLTVITASHRFSMCT